MSLRAKILRCGCEPRLNLPGVEEGPWTCCADCGDAPCYYALLSRCTHWAPDGEKILEPCLLFKKDCIRGCNGWSSRWDNSGQPDQPIFRPLKCVTAKCTGVVSTTGCGLCEDVNCLDVTLNLARCFNTGGLSPDNGTGCFPRFGYETCPELFNDLPYTIRLTKLYQNYYRGDDQYVSCDGADVFDWTWEITLCRPQGSTFINVVPNELTVTERKNGKLYAVWKMPLIAIGGCVDGYTGIAIGDAYDPSGGSVPFNITASVGISIATADCDPGEEPPAAGEPQPKITVEANFDSCYWSDEDENKFRKWQLYKSGEDGYLHLQTRTGAEAIYIRRKMDCKQPQTFYQISRTEPELDGLPRRLCLLPLESEPDHACDTPEDQCNCNDPGTSLASYDFEIRGCDGVLFNGTTSATRSYSGVSWPCGIDFPDPAPCGAFLFDIPLGDCNQSAKMVIWCDGNDYQGVAYCYDDGTECWVEQGSIGITREDRCLGPHLVVTLPTMSCCCPATCEEDPLCDDFDINWPTLTLTLSAPDCPLLDGCTDTLSNGGSGYTWTEVNSTCFGSFTFYRDTDNCWKITGAASDCIEFNAVKAIFAQCSGVSPAPAVPDFQFVAFASGGEFGCPECAGARVTIYITA